MTREDYKKALLNKGFVFQRIQMGYPSRGEQDVFTHPNFKYKFYVTRVNKNDKTLYGFCTGKTNGEIFDDIVTHNAEDDFAREKGLPVWLDGAFVQLLTMITR